MQTEKTDLPIKALPLLTPQISDKLKPHASILLTKKETKIRKPFKMEINDSELEISEEE